MSRERITRNSHSGYRDNTAFNADRLDIPYFEPQPDRAYLRIEVTEDEILNFDELKKKLDRLGYKVSKEMIKKHIQQGLLDKPEINSLGRGLGRKINYDYETFAEVFANLNLRWKHKVKYRDIVKIRRIAKEAEKVDLGFRFIKKFEDKQTKEDYLAFEWIKKKQIALKDYDPDDDIVLEFSFVKNPDGSMAKNFDGSVRIANFTMRKREPEYLEYEEENLKH